MWDPIVIEPTEKPRACLIMLHGLGASNQDFSNLAYELEIPALPMRFIFPQAPMKPVTLNGGMRMPAWYDLIAIEVNAPQDAGGIYESQAILETLIQEQLQQGIPSEHIVLAGFSQGGALALHTALRYPKRLAGVFGLSTYLPLMDRLKEERSKESERLGIVLYHGTLDTVVSLALAQASYVAFDALGVSYEWITYPMAHTVCQQELLHMKQWIQRRLT